MAGNDPDEDFLSQMHLAVLEECPLHEAARGSVDLLLAGPVTHGPWPAQRVAAVLRVWHDAGWITLYFPELPSSWNLKPADWQQRLRPDRTLHSADVTDLLNQPHRWTIDQADGHAAPIPTDLGDTMDYQQWIDLGRRATAHPEQDLTDPQGSRPNLDQQ